MNLFYHLKLNVNALRSDFVYPPKDHQDLTQWKYFRKIRTDSIFTKDIYDFFLQHGLFPFETCLLFYAPPNAKLKIHSDDGNADTFAINWSLTDNRAGMIWYSTMAEGQREVAYQETTPTSYTKFDESEVTEIAREEIRQPSIVRIGIPHGGFNHSGKDAWLVSLRFMNELTFDQVCERFKNFRDQ